MKISKKAVQLISNIIFIFITGFTLGYFLSENLRGQCTDIEKLDELELKVFGPPHIGLSNENYN